MTSPRFTGLPTIRLEWPLPFLRTWLTIRRLQRHVPLGALRRHGFLVAKSGSGKSEFLKLLLLIVKHGGFGGTLNERRSFVLLDPHGDIAQECARQRFFSPQRLWSRASENLVFLSPGLSPTTPPNLNPFDIKKKGYSSAQLEVVAQHLTGAFTAMLSRGDVRLSLHMKTLLIPMLYVLLRVSQIRTKPATFFDLERFFDDDRNADLVDLGHRLKHPGRRRFFQTLFHDGGFRNTRFSLRVKLSSLLSSRWFTALLAQPFSSWDLSKEVNSGKTLIIDAAKSLLGDDVSEIYGRTITSMILSAAFLRGQGPRVPIFYVIDEAATFISPDLKIILAEARKFGLHLFLANQIAKQGGIDREFHDTIMGNTALKIVGNAGSTTRKLMARECDLPEEAFQHLRIGTFVIKSDGFPAKRIRLPTCWLGNRNAMKKTAWERLKQVQRRRYYGTPSAAATASTTTRKSKDLAPRYGRARPP